MVEQKKSWGQRTSNKKSLMVIVDSSSLITLASLIDPQHLTGGAPENPTMLRFLEQLGKMGAEVVIPESVMFECTGLRADGTEFPYAHRDSLQYNYMVNFLARVQEGKIKNVRIEQTPFASPLLDNLEGLKDDIDAYNYYKSKHMFRFGDRDILQLFADSHHTGNIFVLTEDRPLTDELSETKNQNAHLTGVISALKLCADTHRVAPLPWLDKRVTVDTLREYINATHKHDNQKRIANGRARTKGLNQILPDSHKGFLLTPEGERSFSDALSDMIYNQHRGY